MSGFGFGIRFLLVWISLDIRTNFAWKLMFKWASAITHCVIFFLLLKGTNDTNERYAKYWYLVNTN